MARAAVRKVSAPSAITPVAEPVSSYVRPADPARSSLWQVADGLGALDSGIRGFMSGRKGDQDKLDAARGEANFNRDNAPSWGVAVRNGTVSANASPIFQQSWKATLGNLTGLKLRSSFNEAYSNWDGRNTAGEAGFQEFLGGFLSENLDGIEDPYVLQGLNPHVNDLLEKGYSAFSVERDKHDRQGRVDDSMETLNFAIDESYKQGEASPTGTNYDEAWDIAVALRDDAITTGTREEDYDPFMAKTILLRAEESNDLELVALLDRTLPGQKHPMSHNLDIRTARDQTINRIEANIASNETTRASERTKADKIKADAFTLQAVTHIAGDPNVVFDEEFLTQFGAVEPEAIAKIQDWRTKLSEQGEVETQTEVLAMYADISSGAGTADIMQWLSQGRITTGSTLNAMLDRAEKFQSARTEGKGILVSRGANEERKLIQNQTGAGTFDVFGNKGLNEVGIAAIADFDTALIEWEEENPNASALERRKAVSETGEDIRKYITPSKMTDKSGSYNPDGEPTAELEPEPGVVAPEAPIEPEPEAPPEEPAKETDTRPIWEIPLEEQDDTIKQRIEDGAAAKGIPPEEYYKAMTDIYRKSVEKHEAEQKADPEVTPKADPISFSPEEVPQEQKDKLTELLRNPPKTLAEIKGPTEPILELIGFTEGTDKGDSYNESLGYGAYTNGDVELTSMTLKDIDKLQTKMLKHPNNKLNSSALGRFQIIRTTLRKIKKQMGLPDDTLFTPEVQDKMALHLLKGRGLDKWRAGKMSDNAFVNALAKEWASLPTTSGRGHYKGQGVRATPKQVLKALKVDGKEKDA